jgi:periplasmic divalent cation tolerance protein
MEALHNEPKYTLVVTTTDQKEIAQTITQTLLNKGLVACVQIVPCQSHYLWKGEVAHNKEWRLEMKTKTQHFKTIEETIQTLHNYDVPEIVSLPLIHISQSYEAWLEEILQ